MYSSKPVLAFLLFALASLTGYGVAAFDAADRPFGVLLGTLAAACAAVAVITEIEGDDQPQPADPWQVTR